MLKTSSGELEKIISCVQVGLLLHLLGRDFCRQCRYPPFEFEAVPPPTYTMKQSPINHQH